MEVSSPYMLPVMESFYTIQGEGAHTGKAAFFIRLAGCDVGCTWCDVKESWNASEHPVMPIEKLIEDSSLHPAKIVVITGGEPCMYDLTDLLKGLRQSGKQTHIETSGAYPLKGDADWICVSPKKFKKPIPETIAIADELKVVVFHPSDLEWAASFLKDVKPDCQLFLQPEFGKSNKMAPLIVDFVKNNPIWRISLQTHKTLDIP
ncbi:MAG: 7-carboxy-7-deazaguanine synthase QueE [Bacteroidota bacterium]|jgi:7-carboxy-7-deazaguanine synthase